MSAPPQEPRWKLLTFAMFLGLAGMGLIVVVWLYSDGYYTGRVDRMIWSGVCVLLLSSLLPFATLVWLMAVGRDSDRRNPRCVRSEVPVSASPHTPLDQVRQMMKERYRWRWRRCKPWVVVMGGDDADSGGVPGLSDEHWMDARTLMLLWAGRNQPPAGLDRARGRWRKPFDAIVVLTSQDALLAGAAPADDILALTRRIGWRLPVYLVLNSTASDAIASGIPSLRLRNARRTETNQDDLKTWSKTLACDGVLQIVHSLRHDTWLAELSCQIESSLDRLSSSISELASRLPGAQPLRMVSWQYGSAATDTLFEAISRDCRLPAPRRTRRLPGDFSGWLLTGLAGLLAVGLAHSFLAMRERIRDVARHLVLLDQSVIQETAVPGLLALQDRMRRMEFLHRHGARFWSDWGLNRDAALLARLWPVYGRHAHRWVIAPARERLEAVLKRLDGAPLAADQDAARAASASGYDALKAYLMLDAPGRTHDGFLSDQLARVLAPSGDQAHSAIAGFYAGHLAGQPGWRLPASPPLVARARQTLLALTGIEQGDEAIYRMIVAQGEARFPPRNLVSLMPGADARGLFAIPGTLPGVFTREAWQGYVRTAIRDADPKQGEEGEWVLGEASQSGARQGALQQRLLQRYFLDYAAAWQTYLNGLSWRAAANMPEAVEQLNLFTDPQRSPLVALLNVIRDHAHAGRPEQSLAAHLLDKTRDLVNQKVPASGALPREPAAPLDKAFAPLLLLADPSGGPSADGSQISLARYITVATSVRLKLQQITTTPAPEATAGRIAQTLFRGLPNELGEAEHYANLLAASLGSEWAGLARELFVRPLDRAGAVVLALAVRNINEMWRVGVQMPWSVEFSGRFPFNATDHDASLPALGRFVQAGHGMISSFIGSYLPGALDPVGLQWVPSPLLANLIEFDADFLNGLNDLSHLAALLYGSGDARIRFDLMPLPSPGIVQTALRVDGNSLEYFNQKQVWQPMHWPGDSQKAGTRLDWVSSKTGTRGTLEFPGRWAFIRLLSMARVEPLDPARYLLMWDLPDGHIARYLLRSESHNGPLSLLKLRGFVLPKRVFSVPGADIRISEKGD